MISFWVGKNHEGYFDNEDLLQQTDRAINIFESKTKGFTSSSIMCLTIKSSLKMVCLLEKCWRAPQKLDPCKEWSCNVQHHIHSFPSTPHTSRNCPPKPILLRWPPDNAQLGKRHGSHLERMRPLSGCQLKCAMWRFQMCCGCHVLLLPPCCFPATRLCQPEICSWGTHYIVWPHLWFLPEVSLRN